MGLSLMRRDTGTQFTCLTGTKVQILTPEELRHSDGATALHLAAYTGHGDVCALLVSLVLVYAAFSY